MAEQAMAIRSPGELAERIRWIQAQVESGQLRQRARDPAGLWEWIDIREVPATGPWPDYLELHFEEVRGGATWTLTVETYHGVGGRWQQTP